MNKKKIAVILIIIFLIQAVQLLLFIDKNNYPHGWDQSSHALLSLHNYYGFLGIEHLTTEQLDNIYPSFSYARNFYPPFLYMSTVPFYLLFGTEYSSALLVNLLFLLVIILSSFFIGKKLLSIGAGLLAAFTISTVPTYSFLMRNYYIDLSLCAMVSLGYALLLYTNHFEDLRYSILFGISLGLGMLTKWTYILYLIAPICFSLFVFFKNNSFNPKKYVSLIKVSAFVVVALIISLSWYSPRQVRALLPLIMKEPGHALLEGDPVFGLDALFYYFFEIIGNYSLFYFLLFALGAIFFVRYYKRKYFKSQLLFSILVTYAFFTLIFNKDPRYIAPIYVYLACMAAVGINKIKKGRLAQSVIILVVFLGLLQNVAYNSKFSRGTYGVGRLVVFNLNGIYPGEPEFNVDTIFSSINHSNKGHSFSLCVVSSATQLNHISVSYYAYKDRLDVSLVRPVGCNPLEFDYTVVGFLDEMVVADLFVSSKEIIEQNLDKFEQIYNRGGVMAYRRMR